MSGWEYLVGSEESRVGRGCWLADVLLWVMQ